MTHAFESKSLLERKRRDEEIPAVAYGWIIAQLCNSTTKMCQHHHDVDLIYIHARKEILGTSDQSGPLCYLLLYAGHSIYTIIISLMKASP